MEKMKDKKVGATPEMHLSVRYDLQTKRRPAFYYSFSLKGIFFISLFILLLSCWLTTHDTATHSSRNHEFFLSFLFLFLLFFLPPSILGRCERLSMLVSYHITHPRGGLHTQKKDLRRTR